MSHRRFRREVLAACVGLASFALGGCPGTDAGDGEDITGQDRDSGTPPTAAVVVMTDEFSFDPPRIRIERGETVRWRNHSSALQSVTAYQDRIPADAHYFSSGRVQSEAASSVLYPIVGAIRPDETFENTFDVPGTYHYYSTPHKAEGMTGSVIVTG